MNAMSLILLVVTTAAERPVFLDLDREFSKAALVAEVELLEIGTAAWMGRNGKPGSITVRVTSDPGRIWRGFEHIGKKLELKPPKFGPGSCTGALAQAKAAGRTRWLFITDESGKHLMIAGAPRPNHATPGWVIQGWCDHNAVLIAARIGRKQSKERFERTRDVTVAEFDARYGVDRALTLFPLYRRLRGLDRPKRHDVFVLIGELADADSKVRDAAQDDLIFLGEKARAGVETSLEDARNPELELRLGRILDALDERAWIAAMESGFRTAPVESEARIYFDVMEQLGSEDRAAVARRLRELAPRATPAIDVEGLSDDRVLSLWRTRVEPPAYAQKFTTADSRKEFVFSDPKVWDVKPAARGGWLEHRPGQKYETPQRSPHNIGLAADWSFEDFVLECEFLQTGREYGHRDQCVFFGFKNPRKFYYVHISSKADKNAHNVFLVDEKPRKSFARKTTRGVDWGKDEWHKVRVERSVSKGTIKVWFDDMKTPIMEAESKTHGRGWIGFGSFDDEGRVRDIKIWSKTGKRERVKAFETGGEK